MRPFYITLAGIDCGRSSDWIWIANFHVPENDFDTINQISDVTLREVIHAGPVMKTEIKERLEEYQVKYGIMDNEPNIESGARICEMTCLEMGDQRDGQLEEFKESTVLDGGVEYPCWKFRNEKYLRQVLNIFSLEYSDGHPLVRLPTEWEVFEKDNSDLSPFKHLTSPELDPLTGRFEREDDHIDDIYYAAAFCEVAFSIFMQKQLQMSLYIQSV